MTTTTAYRFYTVTEEYIKQPGGPDWYDITVTELGREVARFTYQTRQEAEDALRADGYVKVRDNR